MRGLPPVDCSFRVRRWDAVVLGSALPGLIAAIRLGMRGHRVLILEEDAAALEFPGLRDPFMMAGSGSDGVLGSCLKALEIPLIDRRRIRAAFPAYQVALPRARVDVGDADRTVEELGAWNLSPEETARDLVASLQEGSDAQQRRLLNAKNRAGSRRFPRLSSPRTPSGARLPRRARWQPSATHSCAHSRTSRRSNRPRTFERDSSVQRSVAPPKSMRAIAGSEICSISALRPSTERLVGFAAHSDSCRPATNPRSSSSERLKSVRAERS